MKSSPATKFLLFFSATFLVLVPHVQAFGHQIPIEKLERPKQVSGHISIREVLPKNIPGVRTEYFSIVGPATFQEKHHHGSEVVWLLIDGHASLITRGQDFAVDRETIAYAPEDWTWKIKVPEKTELLAVRIVKALNVQDREDLNRNLYVKNNTEPYVRSFDQCTPYSEAIKSSKTVSRTLLPENYVPRMAVGTVETTGPDRVERHKHPMLEQLFLGLKENNATVTADNDTTTFPPLSMLHIPLGSMHGSQVSAGNKLYYVWMDFFTTREGQEWLRNHKPVTEEPSKTPPSSPAYQDLTHFSKVFQHDKYFRLYLPNGYDQSGRRYPVIYFFHGWGGRHFKDDNAKLEYEKLKALVDSLQVILVMWDGNIEEKEPRPYNVGNHEDVKYQIQMADYFPELVAHIDSHYRTLTDRNHRGIIGFSMGGFMAYFLAGKYPDMVSAMVSLAGSPEFFVGTPDVHTLYPVRYTFKNLQGVHLRMHNGDSDILFYLNQEVHQGALWDGVPIEYWQFHGPHMIDYPGETTVFRKAMNFVCDAFKQDTPPPHGWTHYDLYPNFDAWGYHVRSDKHEPGFITLRNVDQHGFTVESRAWLPDGPRLHELHGEVTTAPIYHPGSSYTVTTFRAGEATTSTMTSDSAGRLTIGFDSGGVEVGISQNGGTPELAFLDYSVGKGSRYLKDSSDNELHLRLFNRGGEPHGPYPATVTIHSNDSSVTVLDSVLFLSLMAGDKVIALPTIHVACAKTPPPHADPPEVRFIITAHSRDGESADEFVAPVDFQVPYFDCLQIDDGIVVREKAFGKGSGDAIPDAGESIMVYQEDHRLRLYTDDPWIHPSEERLADEMIPARWPDGYTLNSVIHIAPDCPNGHLVDCLASYETKTFEPIERKVTWGRVRFIVRNLHGG